MQDGQSNSAWCGRVSNVWYISDVTRTDQLRMVSDGHLQSIVQEFEFYEF